MIRQYTRHRTWIAFAAILSSAGCSGAHESGQDGAREPIFRFVRTFTDTIRLGEALPVRIVVPKGDSIVGVSPGTFGGAERIQVVVDESRLVRAVIFDYNRDADFDSMVAEYASSLGPPTRGTVQRRGEEPADVADWHDARTDFQLIRDPNRSAWTVRSVLRDRAGTGG